jgi:hypothetical protein
MHSPSLRSHRLKGELIGCWACRVNHGIRTRESRHSYIKAPMRKQGDQCGIHPEHPRPRSEAARIIPWLAPGGFHEDRSPGSRLGACMTAIGHVFRGDGGLTPE